MILRFSALHVCMAQSKMIRQDMPQPEAMKDRKRKVMALQRGKVMALHWKYKKSVVLLSMTYNVQMVDMGDNQMKTKFQVVTYYNDRMEGGKSC